MVSLRNVRRSLDQRRNLVEEALEDLVQERMTKSDAPAMSLARDILLAGGKRIRPVLGLLAYEAVGGEEILLHQRLRQPAVGLVRAGEHVGHEFLYD